MTVGARIRQESGSLIQIDPFYENLCLKTSGSVVTTTYNQASTATVQVSGCNRPMLAIYCESAFVGIKSISQSGTTFTWELVADVVGVTISYWIFDSTDVAQMAFVTSKGLRIRNPNDGRVVFDSRYKYMRCQQFFATTAGGIIGTSGVPSYAVAICNSGLYVRIDGGPVGGGPSWLVTSVAYVVGAKCNSNGTVSTILIQITISTQTGQAPPSPPTGLAGDDTITGMILDMTNY